MTHDYSEFKDGPGDNLLAQIGATAQEQKEAEAEVARIEEQLRVAKDNLRRIADIELPQLMDEAEMTTVVTKEGLKVTVKEAIRASIPKAKAAAAFGWLEEHGHDNLIKRQFTIDFGRDEEEQVREFERELSERDEPLNVKTKRSVHPSTLAAFIREQLEEGVAVPLETFGAFRQRTTKVDA